MSNPTQNFPFSTKEELIAADVSPNKTISLFLWERKEEKKQSEEISPGELQVQGVLGVGGMGEVLLAKESFPAREVAIKRPLKKERRYQRALRHEAQVMGALEHPNIIPVHRVFESSEHGFCMVMKKVQGKTLEDYRMYFGDIDWLRKGLSILIQVCNALCYAHNQGVLHRDIKPENIMMGQFGEVYLLDWGAALDLLQIHSAPKAIIGTPSYMAPEMLSPTLEGVGVRTDVFLLGATLHEMLTGEKRHKGNSLKEVLSRVEKAEPFVFDDRIPKKLADLVNAACAQDPKNRPVDVLAFQQELESFLAQWEGHVLFEKSQKTQRLFYRERDAQQNWCLRRPVVRVSKQTPIVNASRGAEVYTAHSLLPTSTIEIFQDQSLKIAHILEHEPTGEFFIEAGIDFVIDKEWRPWCIEINAQPKGRLKALADIYQEDHHQAMRTPFECIEGLLSKIHRKKRREKQKEPKGSYKE